MGVMDGRGWMGSLGVAGLSLFLLGGCDGAVTGNGSGSDNNASSREAQPTIHSGSFRDINHVDPTGTPGADHPNAVDVGSGIITPGSGFRDVDNSPDGGVPPGQGMDGGSPAPDLGNCDNNCKPGTADCDHNLKNGCETNILDDIRNCGGCGRLCAEVANGKSTCHNAQCGGTCNTGFADCNHSLKDGCEANLNSDAANCGACGTACANGQTCVQGACMGPQGCLNNNMPAPNGCDVGKDPESGDSYTVCAADCMTAWISATSSGHFHAEQICKLLGYSSLGTFGGTCNNTCGFCEAPTTCGAPGQQHYDGHGDCGNDMFGKILCFTVQWQCVK